MPLPVYKIRTQSGRLLISPTRHPRELRSEPATSPRPRGEVGRVCAGRVRGGRALPPLPYATPLPGFMIPRGSSAILIRRISAISSSLL